MASPTTPARKKDAGIKAAKKVGTANAPFNLPNADVVFRTADNVDFHLHKNILSIASPFFNDMFSLTQPSKAKIQTTLSDEHIPITENSETVDGLMRLLYPIADPPLTDRVLIEQMLEAALKYQLEAATDTLRRAWHPFIPQHTLSIFATACRLHLQDEAKMAADAWKAAKSWSQNKMEPNFDRTMEGASYTGDMAGLPAGTFFRFLYFLRSTESTAVNFVDPGNPTVQASSAVIDNSSSDADTAPLLFPDAEPDIILRTCDGVDVPAHRMVILLASATSLLTRRSSSRPEAYDVDANAVTLRALLRLIYPFPRVDLGLLHLDAIMRLAKKHNIQRVIALIKEQCVHILPQNSIVCYFLAMKWEWADEARKAAAFISEMNQPAKVIDVYTSAMEDVSTDTYLQLLQHVHQRKVAALNAADSSTNQAYFKHWLTVDGDLNTILTSGIPLVESLLMSLEKTQAGNHYCYSCGRSSGNQRLDCNVNQLNQHYTAYVQFQETIQGALSKVQFMTKFDGVNSSVS